MATDIVTVAPVRSLMVVGCQLSARFPGWNDIFVFLVLYLLTGLGLTVGFHRLLTHRSFKTGRAVRVALAIRGSAAIEGSRLGRPARAGEHATAR